MQVAVPVHTHTHAKGVKENLTLKYFNAYCLFVFFMSTLQTLFQVLPFSCINTSVLLKTNRPLQLG